MPTPPPVTSRHCCCCHQPSAALVSSSPAETVIPRLSLPLYSQRQFSNALVSSPCLLPQPRGAVPSADAMPTPPPVTSHHCCCCHQPSAALASSSPAETVLPRLSFPLRPPGPLTSPPALPLTAAGPLHSLRRRHQPPLPLLPPAFHRSRFLFTTGDSFPAALVSSSPSSSPCLAPYCSRSTSAPGDSSLRRRHTNTSTSHRCRCCLLQIWLRVPFHCCLRLRLW